MAGVGVKLNRIFDRKTISSTLYGATYSAGITITPFLSIIATVLIMGYILGFSKSAFSSQSLFSCTLLYIFIFSELSIAPGNTVLSKYVEDKIYDDRYEDVMPAVYFGLVQQFLVTNLMGIPLYYHVYHVGHIPAYYVFTSYLGLLALSLTLYLMLYLSIAKDYATISKYFVTGMLATAVLSMLLAWWVHLAPGYSLLVGLVVGFWLIAVLEMSRIKGFFLKNSHCYGDVPKYYRQYWRLALTNTLYMLGLFSHNFVFWTSDMRTVVAATYVTANPYDVASTLAMFTNITSNVIFVVQVERSFNFRYKEYSESVIGGRLRDILRAKSRMLNTTAQILMRLVQMQFIISVFVFLVCYAFMPQMGFAGMVQEIYPALAAGYFVLFLYFCALSFLYYYRDNNGALLSAGAFAVSVTLFSILAMKCFSPHYYGAGLFLGSLVGWSVAYYRLHWCEKNLDAQTFSVGNIIAARPEKLDADCVYRADDVREEKEKRMKLLFVVNTMGQAGAETALCALLKKLDPEIYDISLLALIPRGELFERVPKYVHICNKKTSSGSVHDAAGQLAVAGRLCRAALYKGTVLHYGSYFRAVWAQQKKDGKYKPDKLFWRLLSDGTPPQEQQYDAAIAFLEGAATYYVADHVNALKKAAFVHIHYQDAGYSPVTDGDCYERIDRIYPISKGVCKTFLAVYPQYVEKTELFQNLLDVTQIRLRAEEAGGFDDNFRGIRLLTVGRLHEQKGYDIAIEACRLLVERGYDVRWYVIGEGGERGSLERLIETKKLEGRFVLLGRRANPYPYFAGCDIYVHATRFEGKSIAISEAQILGCPIVASDIEGNREQIEPEVDGLLVPLVPQAVCDGIARLIDDAALRKALGMRTAEKNSRQDSGLDMLKSFVFSARDEAMPPVPETEKTEQTVE